MNLWAGFFPASPKRPQVAFAVDLLDLLEALLLECQVAVQDFVAALKYLHNFSAHKNIVCYVVICNTSVSVNCACGILLYCVTYIHCYIYIGHKAIVSHPY